MTSRWWKRCTAVIQIFWPRAKPCHFKWSQLFIQFYKLLLFDSPAIVLFAARYTLQPLVPVYSLAVQPDPYCHYGSGPRREKTKSFRRQGDLNPEHCFFHSFHLFYFWSPKNLDPDSDSPKSLDPERDLMNTVRIRITASSANQNYQIASSHRCSAFSDHCSV